VPHINTPKVGIQHSKDNNHLKGDRGNSPS